MIMELEEVARVSAFVFEFEALTVSYWVAQTISYLTFQGSKFKAFIGDTYTATVEL